MGNLASVVDELLVVDPRELPSVALGEEIVEISRQISRLQAAYLDRVEAFDRTGAASTPTTTPSPDTPTAPTPSTPNPAATPPGPRATNAGPSP